MIPHLLILLGSFLVILAGSEMFTNGVEWAGHRLEIAEAAVGSLLAAVGTALPETFIPAVALLMSTRAPGDAHQAVGIGAIVGAPLMLSTVALAVMAVASLAYRRRRTQIALAVSSADARHDLRFFIPIFMVAVVLGTLPLGETVRRLAAAGLLCAYAFYAFTMLRLKRASESEVEHGLYMELTFGGDPMAPRGLPIALQVMLGVAAILFGAREFVEQVVTLSQHLSIGPGVVSLILSPLATELPEKYNSVVWIRERKDHLALANVTGAMVFQSCIPVALGIAFTPWHLTASELLAGAIAMGSAAILFVNLRDGELHTPGLMVGAAAYGVFLIGLRFLGAL